MEINNLNMLMYSMNKSLEEVENAYNASMHDENEIFFRVGSCLHWIVDCYDRLRNVNKNEEDREWFDGIRGVNNCLKHEITLKKIQGKRGGKKYPYRYPYSYSVYYAFESLDEMPNMIKKQKEAYNIHIAGKNVLFVLRKSVETINHYYEVEKNNKK